MHRFSFASIAIYLISLLPFSVLYVISDGLYLLLYYVIGYRKQVVRENLKNAFPEKSDAERLKIEKKYFKYLPDLILESMKMRTLSEKQVLKRIRFENEGEITRQFEAGKSIVTLTAHYGNWEMAIYRISLFTKNPVLIIYKPLSNKSFDTLFNEIRARFGAIMVPVKNTLRALIKYNNQPNMSVFVADQTPTYQESDYFIKFLNQDTLVYTGMEKIARKFDSPVLFAYMKRIKRGYYVCCFQTIAEQPKALEPLQLTNYFNQLTENIIKEQPEFWLWSHKRWKRKPLQTQ